MGSGEFSVWAFFPDGSHTDVLRWVDAKTAVEKARDQTLTVGARIGTTRRIIITDGGDFTVFEWKYGKGVHLSTAGGSLMRECGSCQLCCKLLAVHDGGVDSDAGERCEHQRHGKGCAIYRRRPRACALWNCAWLGGDFEGRRPDHAHYVVDILPDYVTQRGPDGSEQHCPVVQVWVDPMYPNAHRDPALRAYLARRAEREGMAAMVRYNSRDGFVLVPPSMSQGRGWLELKGEIVNRGYDLADVANKVGGGKVALVYRKGKGD